MSMFRPSVLDDNTYMTPLTNYKVRDGFYISFDTNSDKRIVGMGDDISEAQKDYHNRLAAQNRRILAKGNELPKSGITITSSEELGGLNPKINMKISHTETGKFVDGSGFNRKRLKNKLLNELAEKI